MTKAYALIDRDDEGHSDLIAVTLSPEVAEAWRQYCASDENRSGSWGDSWYAPLGVEEVTLSTEKDVRSVRGDWLKSHGFGGR